MIDILGTISRFPRFESVQDMAPPRDLPIALAHCMVKAKPGSQRMELLNRVYCSMNLVDGIICRAELGRCRRAISDPQPAVIK